MVIGRRRYRLHFVNPIAWMRGRIGSIWGYYEFDACECGCTPYPGWGFQALLIGISCERIGGCRDQEEGKRA